MEDIIYFNIDNIKYSIKKDNNKLLFYRNMEIINNEEDDYQLKNIIELSDKYEKLLKEIYFYLSKYINMPDIEWIKKT